MDQVKNSGDMIGDTPVIEERHHAIAEKVFERIQDRVRSQEKFVIAVGGLSGSGKSEVGALLADKAEQLGKGVYVLSCDNYPHKVPRDNERYRRELYAKEGEDGLRRYLGTQEETDLDRLAQIVKDFKGGADTVMLRIIDNPGNTVAFDAKPLDVSEIHFLVLEGSWSNHVEGVDFRFAIYAKPEETLEHRRKRGRDPLDEVSEQVLFVEGGKLEVIYNERADLVITRDGEVRRDAAA